MWRLYLYFHIRRTERRRLIYVFVLPVVLIAAGRILGAYLLDGSSTSVKPGDWYEILEAHRKSRSVEMSRMARTFTSNGLFRADTAGVETWVRSGLREREATRLSNYLAAGGRVNGSEDLERLNIGDTVWRGTIGAAIIPRSGDDRYSAPVKRTTREAFSQETPAFSLSPNDADEATLIRAGVPDWMAKRWINYRESGGTFRNSGDLGRLYGMDTTWLNRWRDSLDFDGVPRPGVADAVPNNVNINLLDSADWLDLSRIPPWTAGRIVEYRERLGGFVSPGQLYEVYGIDSALVQRLQPVLRTGDGAVRKMNFNQWSVEQLSDHPYISWKQAKVIEFYRTQVRPIERAGDLLGLEGWTDEDVRRIAPYVD